MMKKKLPYLTMLFFIFILSGCVVRTYRVAKDRVDQNLSEGNRGYLMGQIPKTEEIKERKTTRTTQIVEIELFSPIKFKKTTKKKPIPTRETTITEHIEDKEIWGNRGFMEESKTVMTKDTVPITAEVKIEKYVVQKGDTLQKISQKFYGTTKKWNKIYKANQDILKTPDKIYPGLVINIPAETTSSLQVKEPKGALK